MPTNLLHYTNLIHTIILCLLYLLHSTLSHTYYHTVPALLYSTLSPTYYHTVPTLPTVFDLIFITLTGFKATQAFISSRIKSSLTLPKKFIISSYYAYNMPYHSINKQNGHIKSHLITTTLKLTLNSMYLLYWYRMLQLVRLYALVTSYSLSH